MPFDYGLAAGLSARIPYSQQADASIRDMQYGESLRQHNEAMAIAKARMIADDFKMANSTSVYDTPLVREAFAKRAANIAAITKQNPNWQTDPQAMIAINMEKEAAKTDEPVLRAAAYKQAKDDYKKYLADAMNNRGKYNMDDIENFAQQIKNYDQTGHAEGKAGLDRDGNPVALTFTPPQELMDINEFFRKGGDSMNPDDYQPINNGRDGAYIGKVKDETLRKKAMEDYKANQKEFDYRFTKHGVDPIQAIMDGYKPFIKTEYKPGERNVLRDQMAIEAFKHGLKMKEQSPGISVYDESILKPERSVPGADYITKIYTTRPPHEYVDPKGNKIVNTTDDFIPEGDIYEKGLVDPKYKGKKGIKEIPGYFIKSLDWAKDNGYLYDPIGPSGSGDTDLEVRPEFKDQVEIYELPTKDGKTKQAARVKSVATVNANDPMYRTRFNSEIAKMTTKQREAAGIEEGEGQSFGGYQVGSRVTTDHGTYLVTPNGFVKQ